MGLRSLGTSRDGSGGLSWRFDRDERLLEVEVDGEGARFLASLSLSLRRKPEIRLSFLTAESGVREPLGWPFGLGGDDGKDDGGFN